MRQFLAISLLFAIALSPTTAAAQHVESHGQLLLTFGRTFADYSISENESGGIYAHATGFISLRSTPLLFGYFGPEWTISDSKIKLLTGLFMSGDGGMSAIASIWYNQVLPADLNLFSEFDAYFPIDGDNFGHESRQYYTTVSLTWTVNTDSGLGVGVAQENFFSEDDMFEAAIGPTLNFLGGNLWLAYDFTPAIENDHVLVLRLSLNL